VKHALFGAALAISLLLGASASAAAAAQRSPLQWVKVVMLTRHGIRSGTKSADTLARYTTRRWPQWPVARGNLTAHGATAIRNLGVWLRMHYAQAGLLPAKGCPQPGTATVWADNADQRTRVSGQAMIEGLFPGCGMQAYWHPRAHDDPLFHAISTGICPIDPLLAVKAVRRHGDPNAPGIGYDHALARLKQILGDESACSKNAKVCSWARAPNLLHSKRDNGVALSGPLHVGATLSEMLLLEYAQGMPADQVGWGAAASPSAIAAVIPLHTLYSNLMRRTPYLAAHNGTPLAKTILGALTASKHPNPQDPADARKLLLFLGHDTNLANLGAMLGVNWTLPGQPDPTAPDTTLAFELLRDHSGRDYVRLRVYYQTLKQLRSGAAFDRTNPPGALTLNIPGCSRDQRDRLCPMPAFRKLLRKAMVPGCTPPQPSPS
jgi:4-phytase/acid phosphatase